ncbi:hypothetical protein RDWZM_000397 [Blomia tropicalis]|uniref:NADP-dependent oxidoreductase domain-containing protein n=1 Tax=Blomia tropicalis TaxID=40697 RepID=A0A9Q0MCQ5_BLOTA|nr:hypothetical protein RDWZM_000397 [Blomia tropicalis]
MLIPKIPLHVLNNGRTIPIIGLGTWQSAANGEVYQAVCDAIVAGYRHLDCAFVYENQTEIGQAINDSIRNNIVKREDLFITSKIWLTYYTKERMLKCAKLILDQLQLNYIDLLLLHYPISLLQQDDNLRPIDSKGRAIDGGIDYLDAYRSLELLVDHGMVRSIGVSNFTIKQIDRLLANVRIKPVTNQVESHPYLNQMSLKEYCNTNEIVLTAFSPLGNPGSARNKSPDKDMLLRDPVVVRLAKKYSKNEGQILIKFQVQNGNLVIPKSVRKSRIISNIDVFDFQLTKSEMDELLSLDRNYRTCRFAFASHLPEYPF